VPVKKNLVLPVAAAVALALLLWLAFHDRSSEPAPGLAPVKTSRAAVDQHATGGPNSAASWAAVQPDACRLAFNGAAAMSACA
jgi:hypothetical protein